MANTEKVLPSGAKLQITTAPFAEAHALLKALLSASKGLQLKTDVFQMDVSVLKDVMIEAATSDGVESALFRCMERAAYDGIKCSRTLFDDAKIGEQARADYYVIAWHVIEQNCAPFFGQAFSLLRERFGTQTAIPKSQ